MLLHLFGTGDLLDNGLLWMFTHMEPLKVTLHPAVTGIYLVLSLLAVRFKAVLYVSLFLALAICVYAIVQVAV